MPISLVSSLGIERKNLRLAIVGAGGKTSTLIRLSRQLSPPVVMTTTTHVLPEQADLADESYIIHEPDEIVRILDGIEEPKTFFFTGGESEDGRLIALSDQCQVVLVNECTKRDIPLLVEADGARSLCLKAPAEHEPVIPEWVNATLVIAGLKGLNQPLCEAIVHRPERFSKISGIKLGENVTPTGLANVLLHPEGGLKRIPPGSRRLAFLNQANTDLLMGQAKIIAEKLITEYNCVVIGHLLPEEDRFEAEIDATYIPIASVILAAGDSSRLGQSKVLFRWKGESLIHRSVRIALEAGLWPVIVVAGSDVEQISAEVSTTGAYVIHNKDWKMGQSTSVKTGLKFVPQQSGAVIFQVVDQPGLTKDLIWALKELYYQTRGKIIQPQAAGSRTNPVLFDRSTFIDLMEISGDQGGRSIFHKYSISYLPWHDPGILLDLDNPEDIDKLHHLESANHE